MPNIYLLRSQKPSAHSYLINDNILIDVGAKDSFLYLKEQLAQHYKKAEDIQHIVLTHAHYDHSSANEFFPNAIFYAHPYAASALIHQDESLIHGLKHGFKLPNYREINLLNDGDLFLDEWLVIHTPGHSIDSICLYHPQDHILISGDTVFAKGIPALITSSGSDTALIYSIEKLQKYPIAILYPGHGISEHTPNLELSKRNIIKRIQQNNLIIKNEVSL